MYVITNMTDSDIMIDGVSIEPKRQLSIQHLTPDMEKAKEAGTLRVLSGDESLEERKANIASYHLS